MRLTFVDNLIANLAIKNIGAKRAEFEADLELRNDRQVADVFGVLREAKQMTSYVTFRGEYKDGKLIGSCEELKPGTEYYVWIAATSTGFPEAEGAAHRIYSNYGKFTTAEGGSLVIDDVHSTREDYLHVLGKGHAENIPDWETKAYFGNWEKQTESSWESVFTGAGTVDPEAGTINFDFQATEIGHYRLTIMDGLFEHEYVSESYEFDITEPKEGKLIIDDVHQVEGEPLHVYGKGHAQDIEKWEELGYVAHWEKLEDGTWVFAKNTAATNKPEEGIIDFDYRADSIPGGMGEGHYRVSLQEASKTPLYVSDYVEFDIIVDNFRISAPTFVEPMKPELFEAFAQIVETIDGAVIKDAYFAYAEKGQEPAIKAPAVVDFPKLSVKSTMEYKAGTTITCRFEVVYEYLGETHQAVGDEADYLIPEPVAETVTVDKVEVTGDELDTANVTGHTNISGDIEKVEAHWFKYDVNDNPTLITAVPGNLTEGVITASFDRDWYAGKNHYGVMLLVKKVGEDEIVSEMFDWHLDPVYMDFEKLTVDQILNGIHCQAKFEMDDRAEIDKVQFHLIHKVSDEPGKMWERLFSLHATTEVERGLWEGDIHEGAGEGKVHFVSGDTYAVFGDAHDNYNNLWVESGRTEFVYTVEQSVQIDDVEHTHTNAVCKGTANFPGPYHKAEVHWGYKDKYGERTWLATTPATWEGNSFTSELGYDFKDGYHYDAQLFVMPEGGDFVKSESYDFQPVPGYMAALDGFQAKRAANVEILVMGACGICPDGQEIARTDAVHFHVFHKKDKEWEAIGDVDGNPATVEGHFLGALNFEPESGKLIEGDTYKFTAEVHIAEVWYVSEPWIFKLEWNNE